MDQRLKGQEVEIRITQAGVLSTAIKAPASFNETVKFEKKEDGFLGETTNRYDTIYNGVDGSIEFQVSDQEWMLLQQAIQDKARRKTPDVKFNLVRTDFYANGDTPSRTYTDVEFGPQPTSVASRGDFVKVTLDFSCSEYVDDLQGVL